MSVGGAISTADAMQTVVHHMTHRHATSSMRVVTPQVRSRYSTVVSPRPDELKEVKLTERNNLIRESERLSQQLKTTHLPSLNQLFDVSEYQSFSQDIWGLLTTYYKRTSDYGVIQQSYPYLYDNIRHQVHDSYLILCSLIDWIQSNKYVGQNMIAQKYEDNLIHQQQISRYFMQRDSSFDGLPDDLKNIILQIQKNSEKLYKYNNDLLTVLNGRITKVFDTNLCIKVLQNKVKPVLTKLNPELNEYIDQLSDCLKYFDREYKAAKGFKPLPDGDRNFDYYNHLWYDISDALRPACFAVKFTPKELVAEKILRNIKKNIEIRHDPNDDKPFIKAPYIIDRSKE